jgi:hypothetical protein
MTGCLPTGAYLLSVIMEVSHIQIPVLPSCQVPEPLLSGFEMVYPLSSFRSSGIKSKLLILVEDQADPSGSGETRSTELEQVQPQSHPRN